MCLNHPSCVFLSHMCPISGSYSVHIQLSFLEVLFYSVYKFTFLFYYLFSCSLKTLIFVFSFEFTLCSVSGYSYSKTLRVTLCFGLFYLFDCVGLAVACWLFAAHRLNCPRHGICLPDQDWTLLPCIERYSEPLDHQGGPWLLCLWFFLIMTCFCMHLEFCSMNLCSSYLCGNLQSLRFSVHSFR